MHLLAQTSLTCQKGALIATGPSTGIHHTSNDEACLHMALLPGLCCSCICSMQDYYEYLQCYSHPGPDLMRHIHDLPTPLGTDMTIELYKPTLAKVPLFVGAKHSFIEYLARGLSLAVYLKGEHLHLPGTSKQHSESFSVICLLGQMRECAAGLTRTESESGFRTCEPCTM
jgi:hypothetical protein